MKSIGIDIGTTTVSAVVCDDGAVLESRSVESRASLPTQNPWEKIQDPARLLDAAASLLEDLLSDDVARIGLAGQQHGIVYLDSGGNALSPLYTWQDGRGDLEYRGGLSYARYLEQVTGHRLATGYGLVTHFYNLCNGLVPEGAVKICTIQDYVAMKLAGLSEPFTDPSDAASLGFFDVRGLQFDVGAVANAGIDPAVLPEIYREPCLGEYKGRKLCVAIGDNQAGFIGATSGDPGATVVNVGTSSQVSVHVEEYCEPDTLEIRPFPLGGYLLVGAALCGGRSIALLDRFFCDIVQAVTSVRPEHCYSVISSMAGGGELRNLPSFAPLFQGTRLNPSARASITNLDADNFTPAHLAKALFDGMAAELREMYSSYSAVPPARLYGAGNAVRLNAPLRESLQRAFGTEMTVSQSTEETALGAAIFASLSSE